MNRASTAPTSSRPKDATKGRSHRPVASITAPKATGEIIPASPKPKFMKPLAVPACWGAMSIGTAQIGATISSAKKKAPLRQIATVTRSVTTTTGSMHKNAPRNPTTITLTRALDTLPVRRRIRSLATPPTVSPMTPAKKTPDAKIADLPMFRWYW